MKKSDKRKNFYEIILETTKRIHTEKLDSDTAKAEAAKIMLRQSCDTAQRAVEFFTIDELASIFDAVRSLVEKDCSNGAIIAIGNDSDLDVPEFYSIDTALSPEARMRINADMGEEVFRISTASECGT